MSIQTRLCNISKNSWHFRLVEWVSKVSGEQLVISSACHYWCAIVPACVFATVFIGLIGLAFGGAVLWLLGDLAIWSYQHPLKMMLYVMLEIGLCVGLIALCIGSLSLGERIKKRCPPLTIDGIPMRDE